MLKHGKTEDAFGRRMYRRCGMASIRTPNIGAGPLKLRFVLPKTEFLVVRFAQNKAETMSSSKASL